MTRRRALLLLAAALGGPPTRGSAHGFLERSDPRAGSSVKRPPERVRLWFTGAIEPAYSGVQVLTERGQRVDVGVPSLDGARKSLTVTVPPLPPGRYRVKWRVLSVDTHVTEGEFEFRVAP
jgi:hypothetical protein